MISFGETNEMDFIRFNSSWISTGFFCFGGGGGRFYCNHFHLSLRGIDRAHLGESVRTRWNSLKKWTVTIAWCIIKLLSNAMILVISIWSCIFIVQYICCCWLWLCCQSRHFSWIFNLREANFFFFHLLANWIRW